MRLFDSSLAPIAAGCALDFGPPDLDGRAGRPWLEVGAAFDAADETRRHPVWPPVSI